MLNNMALSNLTQKTNHLNLLSKLLTSLSFENTLTRGFAIIRDGNTNKVIKSINDLEQSKILALELSDGKKIVGIS